MFQSAVFVNTQTIYIKHTFKTDLKQLLHNTTETNSQANV